LYNQGNLSLFRPRQNVGIAGVFM